MSDNLLVKDAVQKAISVLPSNIQPLVVDLLTNVSAAILTPENVSDVVGEVVSNLTDDDLSKAYRIAIQYKSVADIEADMEAQDRAFALQLTQDAVTRQNVSWAVQNFIAGVLLIGLSMLKPI